ncbi:MAG: DUF4231 domain-containing protein [Gemmatimonadetes bacterium]|nr:DUF4231 domain-containing protein [Gemmatimonadota bacterium]
MNPHVENFFRRLVKHRWVVVMLHAGLFIAGLLGARAVRVDYSAEQFLVFEGDAQEVFEQYKEHFPREDLQVSAFLETTGPFTTDDYQTLEQLANAFTNAGLDPVRWIGTTDFIQEVVIDGESAVEFVRLEDQSDVSDATLQTILEPRREHPLFMGTLWNQDLSVFGVHGYLAPTENNDAHRREVTAALQSTIADLSETSGRIVLSGLPVLRTTIPLALEADMTRLLGIGIIISFIILWLYFRRFSIALLCFAGVVPAIVLTLGLMGYAGQSISVLTSVVPIVILVVALSDATHLVVGTREAWRNGRTISEAVVHTFTNLSRSCFFTSLTTALGFAGLIATRNHLIGEFGVLSALAVIVAYLVTLTLLPALLAFTKDLGPHQEWGERLWQGILTRVESLLQLPVVWPSAAFGLLLAVGLIAGSQLRVEAYIIDDLKERDTILEELRWIEDEGFGLFQINVYLDQESDEGHSPEMLQWIEEFQAFVEEDPAVLGSVGLPQIVNELGTAYGTQPVGSDPTSEIGSAEVRTRREIAELLFLAELEDDDALRDVYLRDAGVGQMIVLVKDQGSQVLSPLTARVEDRLQSHPPPTGRATATGTVKLTTVLWEQLISRFVPGIAFSIVLVWLALSWMFRSVWLGLLAVVPNLVPLVLLLGLMGLGGFDLKPSNILVFAIAFGIVADDTIHFLGALARNLRSSNQIHAVLAQTIREVGPALVLVTVVVVAGFTALMASRFQALFLIGFLTASAAVLALLADLVGFPALLRIVARHPAGRSLITGDPK